MRGWFNQSYRHSLASRGIKTSFSRRNFQEINMQIPQQTIAPEVKEVKDEDMDKFVLTTGNEEIDALDEENRRKHVQIKSPIDAKIFLETYDVPLDTRLDPNAIQPLADYYEMSDRLAIPYVIIENGKIVDSQNLEYIDVMEYLGKNEVPIMIFEEEGLR